MSESSEGSTNSSGNTGGHDRRTFVQGIGQLPVSGYLLNNRRTRTNAKSGNGKQGVRSNGTTRTYSIHAVRLDIVYNRYGLHQPNGAAYVLESDLEDVRGASGKTPDDGFALIEDENATDENGGPDPSKIEPLVIRANEGDTVKIEFHNHLDERASIHQTGLPYDVQQSDGMSVGYNADTTTAPGETITYEWEATHTGTHFFYDGANQAVDSASGKVDQVNLLKRGLFGALVVEPPGATWTDPETGGELRSGVRADITDPNGLGTSYREFVTFYHSPSGMKPRVDWPHSNTEQSIHAINYRADPSGQRVNNNCPDCDTEETFYHSWTHGDPGGGDNVYAAYKGDPIKFCFVGASAEENHVHHLHQHRWKQVPDTDADTVDAQTIGLGDAYQSYLVAGHGTGSLRPGMKFEEAFEVGAGYVHGTTGDILFHCHLFPHYAEGMWGTMRVLDKERDFLQPLPNTSGIIPADSETPGFPEFVGDAIKNVNGVQDPTGYQAPEPPNQSVDSPREPTAVEKAALGDTILPGAPYADPAPDTGANRTIEYTIAVMSTDIAYNDAGEHDPDGICYVLEEANVPGVTDGPTTVDDAARVRNGEMNPEPLFLRANVGDEVIIRLKNELTDEGYGASIHPHFVGFDVQGSDSLGNGFNYYQGCDPGETNEYRWFADEQGAIYFHDHIVALSEGQHGMFCGLLVEPRGSEWRDPYSDAPIFSGAQANIITPEGSTDSDFREQALHYHDFAPLKDQRGEFITDRREHNTNAGTMAINYRNTPYYTRGDADSAYVHSSQVHGDPSTPVLEAYEGDQIRFRLFQGAYEEQHNFAVHGLRMNPEGFSAEDHVSELISPSEAFTYKLTPEATQHQFDRITNPDDIPVRDYRYGSNIVDDLWCGMWGLVRIWGGSVTHLQALDDYGAPDGTIADAELAAMGHPSQFSDHDWTADGQRARLLYSSDETDTTVPPDRDARQNENVGRIPPQPAADDKGPGTPAPSADVETVREYNITAFQTEIPYNDHGDSDPSGIVFAFDRYVDEIKAGQRPVEPLTLHANEGDLVKINLTNELPADLDNSDAHPQMRIKRNWDRSTRISLHPSQVRLDVNGSNGSAVGFNYDTTVGRGDTISYAWHADVELGTVLLTDVADIRSNRHHGAYGQLIVNQSESIALTNHTAEATPGRRTSMIKTKSRNADDFRQKPLLFADAQYITNRDAPSRPIVPSDGDEGDTSRPNQIGEAEDHGYAAINYRSEPFRYRFQQNDSQHLVFSSDVHGDPNTPILRALSGDPVRFRVGCVADKARGISFHLAGHQWQRFQGVDASPVVGVDGSYGPGKAESFDLINGAGGPSATEGDYLYQETKQGRRLESGLWGIFRVRDDPNGFEQDDPQPLPQRSTNVPLQARPGYVVAKGKITGGNKMDLVVGVPESDIGAYNAGGVYVFTDTPPGQVRDLSNADLAILSETTGRRAGIDVTLTDATGDGGNRGPGRGRGRSNGRQGPPPWAGPSKERQGPPPWAGPNRGTDIVVHTDGDGDFVVDGESLQDLIRNEPPSALAEFVRNTTNTEVSSIVPLEEVGTPRSA
ncbi:multicopper oxidase domain-containing protein [Natrinema halophilum]|uniref:Multicopper oxidase domain-containing protein n=1 Tax=Natrinema halophilum TaxID=1699371 RepID=A0A7D5GFS6_9EURY|nr:multicopper oxidase domain-containing protein [Natrinema halophilum]QLG47768.1 multicopper oxidase domain-containing protein [Natrinema halophilum]